MALLVKKKKKKTTCQYRRRKRHGFDSWVGKIPWRRAWQPTPVFLPRESHGQRSLAGYGPWGCKEPDTSYLLDLAHISGDMEGRNCYLAQMIKNLPAMQETRVQSLGQEDPLEKEVATHSNILAWESPWTEETGRLQSMGSQELDTI